MNMKKRQWKRTLGLGLFGATVNAVCPIAPQAEAAEWVISEDQFSSSMKLNLTLGNPKIILGPNGLARPAEFFAYTNYPQLISSYKLSIYAQDDISSSRPLKTFTWTEDKAFSPIVWDGTLDQGKLDQKSYKAVLEVTGKNGKKDISLPVLFDVVTTDEVGAKWLMENQPADEPQDIPGYGVDNTGHRGITADASYRKVVIQASGIYEGATLNGQSLVADAQGNVVRELVLPPGKHDFTLEWTDADGKKMTDTQTIDIVSTGKNEIFFIGQADLTVSGGNVSGHKEVLNGDYHYESGVHADGRLAFYLKGTIKDKYRVTAQMDTGEDRTNRLFKGLDQRDPRRVFREIDPEQYYPIYGDDSTLVQDVDTEGKFYIKIEKNKDHILWGNYNTGFTGTEFGEYNRSLYGFQLRHESTDLTKFGDTKNYLSGFIATSQSRASHNEFLSTGGSLYYLKYQRVTEGSAKLTAELRDKDTGRVVNRATLTEGTDYEIDNYQGRILLKTALPLKVKDGSLITSNLQNGSDVYLVVDFEYYSDDLDMSNEGSKGLRGYSWLGDKVRIGGTWVDAEQTDGTDSYRFYGIDLQWKPTPNTYTNIEYAKSESGLGSFYSSENGGLNFTQKSTVGQDGGTAFKIEQEIDFRDFSKAPVRFSGYYSRKNEGFSNLGTVTENDTTEYGASVDWEMDPDNKSGLKVRTIYKEEEDVSKERRTGLQYYREFSKNQGFRGAVEVQSVQEWNPTDGSGHETLAAVKLEKDLRGGKDKVYVIQQVSINHSDNVEADNKTTLGFETQIKEYLRANLEGVFGNRGNGANGGLTWDVNPRVQVYGRYSTDIDSTSGKSHTMTYGANWKMNSKWDIYSEKQFEYRDEERSTSDVYGVKYKPSTNETWDISYAIGEANNNSILDSKSQLTTRDVVSAQYTYTSDTAEGRHKIEYRREKGGYDGDLRQIVTTNRIKTKERYGWSLLGQLDYAHTSGGNQDYDLSNYSEFAFGFAYRPVNNDKLNLFGKVTYIAGIDPDSQFIAYGDSGTGTSDYEQKSTVYALEGVYEISSKWEVAAKAAYRTGDMRLKGDKDWYSSGAELYAIRANYRLNKHWDALVEWKTLRVATAEDAKSGWLAAIYRKVSANAKVGVGYNWTDYNDDLTHLNYNSRGWFVNVIGTW